MNLNYLKFFVSVANIGSLNQSANELFISPQGLSRAIRQLESEMEVSLFDRDNGGMKLTPAGEKVYEYATKILDINSEMESHLSALKYNMNVKDSLTISAFPIISSIFMPKILPKFFKSIPNVNLQIMSSNFSDVSVQIESASVDIIVVNCPKEIVSQLVEASSANWTYYTICDTKAVALASKSASIPFDAPLTPELFSSFQKVYFANAEIFASMQGFPSDSPLLKTNDYSLFRSILTSNKYSLGFSDSAIEQIFDDKNLRTVPLPIDIDLEYGVFIRNEAREVPSVREFIKLLFVAMNTSA